MVKLRYIRYIVGGVTLATLSSVSQAQLASFGPFTADGYPSVYTASDGLALVQALDLTDPLLIVEPGVDPGSPFSVPDGNFPGDRRGEMPRRSAASSRQ